MILPWILSGLGLVILLLAGDALVKGAVNLSLRFGVPALIVSLTIVAFGTSAPELLISIQAILDGVPSLALGNVVGSNTANVLLVLGLPALLATMHTSECNTRKTFRFMIIATVVFIALGVRGVYDWIAGTVLLIMMAGVLYDAFRQTRKHRRADKAARAAAAADCCDDEEVEGADPDMKMWMILAYLVAGLVGLPLGAQLLVSNATIIAQTYGVSDTVIGLTLVAVGTSLPELATTVMAALRRQADVALGNVIGSNIFNLLGIIGVASFVGPIPVDPQFLQLDFWVMLAASLLLLPFVYFRQDISRLWGVILTALYVAYVMVVLFWT
ncbi:calcium/sodium antiporter [Sulfitobacter pseudonitzschiae]|uniref:Calcium/sodium antiporter n=1 Tax=Pseudosulfitobacter pseudonitzschiae TaxID=1402135 RepID=A0A9Q2NLP3_9RHOB|nr:calcium/sodium antiporter [Pseudosulfitobacter pseudonitzschiae]MBM2291856.1 calcium/sodium antiporter [Pseudosulfitobacter pseudonitzschiae]MBM2296774.1 calcium/sodium antiporter [Pseudosulfitobacter pseudonitzschiae]MBM2301687.1 calcium/sodium antiporter [Pseudosulfitobacter pseudonitzschiae]MBM2311470.1 calcium/sodium antiporter [Pseudosulfitobacter pseudonitzschiae]MBM2316384.1 calcium/sodium antiporter [Pseudosulfitobacter pseudonitzschiae]